MQLQEFIRQYCEKRGVYNIEKILAYVKEHMLDFANFEESWNTPISHTKAMEEDLTNVLNLALRFSR